VDEPRPSSVYIRAYDRGTLLYGAIVNEGSVFSIPLNGQDLESISIDIRDLTESFGPGKLLQVMRVGARCQASYSLNLFDTFGSLQLVGFRNEEEGLKAIYADVTIHYTIINTGTRGMLLTGAFKTTPFVGTQSLTIEDEPVLLEQPGDEAVFSELLTVNLAAIVGGDGLDFGLIVQGEDAVTKKECGDEDTYSLKIDNTLF